MFEVRPESWPSPGMTNLSHRHAYGYGFQNTGTKIQEDCAYTRAGNDVNAAGETLSTPKPDITKNPSWSTIQTKYDIHSGDRPPVGSDDLLLEKFGVGVNELICREPRTPNAKDNSCTNRNSLSPASYSPPMDKQNLSGAWGNNRIGNGVVGVAMSPLLKRNRKKRDGVEVDEEDDSTFQAVEDFLEEFLLSVIGEDFEVHKDAISDILGHCEGDTEKSLKWLLELASFNLGRGSQISLDTHKSVAKLYFDKKLGAKRDPSHPLGANQHKDSGPTLYNYQGHNGDAEEGPNFLLKYGVGVSKTRTSQEALSKQVADPYSEVKVLFDRLKALFPAANNNYLFEKLWGADFNLRDAEKNISGAYKADLTNFTHRKKSNVLKDNGAARTTPRLPPLRALWADIKPIITPLEHSSGVISAKEYPSGFGFVEMKKPIFKSYGDFDDYGRTRQGANEHWNAMKYYFEEAAAAYDRGEKCRAAELSDKGKSYKQSAQELSARASNRLFGSRNKDIENNITIDLHAQHVNEALEILRRHLQSFSSIPLVTMLTIITGHGSHSIDGRARVKPAVIRFLSDCSIPWQELNDGCLTVKMKDVRNNQLEISSLA